MPPIEVDKNAPVSGLPAYDANADRGSDFTPEAPAATVELTAEELAALGSPEKAAAAEPPKADVKADDKGDEVDPAKADGKVDDKVDPAKADDKVDDKAEPADKGKFIPKARFDEVNNRAKLKVAALEAQVADLKARVAPIEGHPDTAALETTLDAKTAEYTQLVADGEIDKANAAMKEINRINRQIGTIEATAVTGRLAEETQHVDALGQMVQLYKDAYPIFDDAQTEVYRQDVVDFVAKLQGRFEATGSSPAEALREAVELAVSKYNLDPEPETAAPAAAAAEPAKTPADARKAAAVTKAVAAAAAQPPSTAKVGHDSDKAGISNITQEQLSDYKTFEALAKNESTLQRLRGDFA